MSDNTQQQSQSSFNPARANKGPTHKVNPTSGFRDIGIGAVASAAAQIRRVSDKQVEQANPQMAHNADFAD